MKLQVGEKCWSLYFNGASPQLNYDVNPKHYWAWGNIHDVYEGTVKGTVMLSEVIKELLLD